MPASLDAIKATGFILSSRRIHFCNGVLNNYFSKMILIKEYYIIIFILNKNYITVGFIINEADFTIAYILNMGIFTIIFI